LGRAADAKRARIADHLAILESLGQIRPADDAHSRFAG